MPSTIVVNPNPTAQPTDGNAVNNIQVYITGGHGGPNAVFDKDHYKSQIRVVGSLIEFNAIQGTLNNLGYVWSVNIIKMNDDNTSFALLWPITDLAIKHFVQNEMNFLIENRFAKKIYLATAEILVDVETATEFPWD